MGSEPIFFTAGTAGKALLRAECPRKDFGSFQYSAFVVDLLGITVRSVDCFHPSLVISSLLVGRAPRSGQMSLLEGEEVELLAFRGVSDLRGSRYRVESKQPPPHLLHFGKGPRLYVPYEGNLSVAHLSQRSEDFAL